MPRKKPDGSLREYQKKRDFQKTSEPSGGVAPSGGELRFVVQKHAASQLHFDLRLEMGGVMRSWAVPKGPSLDPAQRRLAMEVEDHPIEYNDFEGTIPEGEYGGGTVMIWDRGKYSPDEVRKGESDEKAALRGYRSGKLSVTFAGDRLRGSFALVRTDAVAGGPRSKWLLIKHKDEFASTSGEITETITRSVATDRTMDEIAAGEGGSRVWRSNRGQPKLSGPARTGSGISGPSALKPMLASSRISKPAGDHWTFEPKYDGIRILAFATADSVALLTRNGHDKARQFPEIVEALENLSAEVGKSLVLDGEIVALENGEISRFERLQGRMHLRESGEIERKSAAEPAAFVAFDVLLIADEVLLSSVWTERRNRLEEVLSGRVNQILRLSETSGHPNRLRQRAEREGWEGLMAKRRDSTYRPGERTTDWLKLKIENRQEFVVGGWTEPRKSRSHLGAILLGYYDDGAFVYAGHTGTGFTAKSLAEIYRRLKPLERKTPPFESRPTTNETPHWTTPRVVVEVRFNEWTRDGKLRQPVFLGIRDDKDPREVIREPPPRGADDASASDPKADTKSRGKSTKRRKAKEPVEADNPLTGRLERIAESGGEGELKIGRGASIQVTSLEKVFFPKTGHTKVDLLNYYARMESYILPRMKDRPLVLKRFPNGVEGEAFYQQAAPDSVPPGVRVETIRIDGKDQRRLIGGNLATLLYTVQLGAISYDPWHSRLQDLTAADYSIIDLDPGPGASFRRVVQVAGWVKEEMDELSLHGALKTSGSSGLHIYLPLPKGTPLEAAQLVARIIATRVAEKHPKEATVERLTKNRPRGTVYVDFLQNILGKTVAGVYAVRAKATPTVSTPLAWEELTPDLDLRDFTVDSVPDRAASVGDLWAEGMARANKLTRMLRSARE